MKKLIKTLSVILCCLCMVVSPIFFTGCNFSVNYKYTSERLNELVTTLTTNENFEQGVITVNSKVYAGNLIPARNAKFRADSENFEEINQIYDTMFSYSVKYIRDCAELFKTPPTVETLNEVQENMYAELHNRIEVFNNEIKSFEKVIKDVNKFYSEQENYGISSKKIHVLNYKEAYYKLIDKSFDVANSLEKIEASVYTEIDYEEFKDKKGQVFKSLDDGILIRVFEGYFTFLVDSFGYRVPTLNVDANEYMKEIMSLYNKAKVSYLSLYQAMKSQSINAIPQFTQTEINSIKLYMDTYFEEIDLYKNAYNYINFVTFYFDDDCDLDRYVEANYANKNYYDKICDYIGNILPSLTQYITLKFFS